MIVRLLADKMEFENGRPKPTYKHKLLAMIDEFPALGKLEILQQSLAFVAGYGIKCYLISQDINQLKSRETGYGPDETITSNCHVQAAFPPIFGVVVHRCGIDSPRSGPALNNLLEQHPSVSSVRFAISAESARDAPWNPPFGASSWAWHILSFRRFFLWKTFFILSASGLALVWHLRRRFFVFRVLVGNANGWQTQA